jgi:hypothetical protein
MDKHNLDNVNKTFEKGKDFANKSKERYKELADNGINIFTIAIISMFGLMSAIIVIVLQGIDFSNGFTLTGAIDIPKVIISFVFLILGILGYVLFTYLSSTIAQETDQFSEKLGERKDEIEKINDMDNFNQHRLNTNHKNKLQQWLNLIDYKLIEKYGFKRLFTNKKKWDKLNNQTTAYVNFLKPNSETEEDDIGHFNINNVKIKYKKWKESYFIKESVNVNYQENESPDVGVVGDLAKKKVGIKIGIWFFTTLVTILSIDMWNYGINNLIAIVVNLAFITYACVSGFQDGYNAMLTKGIAKLQEHINFVKNYIAMPKPIPTQEDIQDIDSEQVAKIEILCPVCGNKEHYYNQIADVAKCKKCTCIFSCSDKRILEDSELIEINKHWMEDKK